MGPFELIDLIGLDVNLERRPLLLRPGRRAGALAAEPDPGASWSPKAASAARAATASTSTATDATRASADPDLGIEAPTLDPAELAKIDPAAERDPPPPLRPDRQRGRLRARRGGRLARRHGHGDAARLQLAARPAGDHRADRRRRAPSSCSRTCGPSTARPTPPAPPARPSRRLSMSSGRKPASEITARRNREAAAALPPESAEDFADAERGLVARFEPARVEGAGRQGRLGPRVLRLPRRECPETANPSLWRQASSTGSPASSSSRPASTSCAASTSRTCTWSRASDGIVVIDPLISAETAAAALALYREHRGERPVTGLSTPTATSTTSAAPRGRLRRGGRPSASIPVLAPDGLPPPRGQRERLRRHGDGPARRLHVRGAAASAAPTAQIGAGLGQTTSLGTLTLIPPNLEVDETGQEETVDGVRMVFQLTPGPRRRRR